MLSLIETLYNQCLPHAFWRIVSVIQSSLRASPEQVWRESRCHCCWIQTDAGTWAAASDTDTLSGVRKDRRCTLQQLELNCCVVWTEENWAPTESAFSQGFFSILSPMQLWFLAAVASGLLSLGHFISSDIVDLIEQILFNKLKWAGRLHHWINDELTLTETIVNWVFTIVLLHYWHTICVPGAQKQS